MDILSSKSPQDKPNGRWPKNRIPAYKQPCYTCGERPREKHQAYCSLCLKSRRKIYNRRYDTPERVRERNMRRLHNISLEEYEIMFFRQGGICAICGNPQNGKKPLAIDHNHKTGDIRELLCFSCNTLTGYIEKDYERVKKVMQYLKKHDT